VANRENHYESAFEAFLRARRVAYVAVDEARRSLLAGDGSLKSLDFLVSTPGGGAWLVDVKGRRFPSGAQRRYWKNWSTRDDLKSLAHWEELFGEGFQALFVFAYRVMGRKAPVPPDLLFRWRETWYGFVGIPLRQYAAHAQRISPRWDTVAMPVEAFRRLAAPVQAFL
jgi:hypothetical protein